MKQNLYNNSARLYDIGNSREAIEGDLAFYLYIIGPDQSVLEIACGTGRVAIALARRGNRVVGLDLSPDMLQVFRDKLVDEACVSNITLYEGDMENFALGEQFDWVIFPFRAFQSLSSDATRKA